MHLYNLDTKVTDKSYEILLKYKNIDNRIHIFKNLNSLESASRAELLI